MSGGVLRNVLPYIGRMNAPLYNTEILRLAAPIPHNERLADPMGSAEKRSRVYGSRVTVDINVDDEGRVAEVGLLVRACALGQASSSLMAASVIGKSPEELAAARDAPAPRRARLGAFPPGPPAQPPPRLDPARLRSSRRGRRDRPCRCRMTETLL